jgi:hypothetical protein
MRHDEFVAAYHRGAIRVHVDKAAAARFVSARLLLPLVMLPVLGLGTALALAYSAWIGLAIIGVGTLVPILIKRSAPHFVLTQALHDPAFFNEVSESGLLEIIEHGDGSV